MDLTLNGLNLQKFNDQHFQWFKKIYWNAAPALLPPQPMFMKGNLHLAGIIGKIL